ncbi:unnamed protein product [Brassica napus]|uniref:(rape) hypothetical protein n=1 Tax=Brassica napus TaxID=3708 RepID=A0A816IVL1_BRANA|nr:unnamed protein product [Brassica napus]
MAVVPIACTMPRILTNPSGLERRSNPLRVVRFQLKNNKMPEPKVPVRFDLDDHEQEPKEKSVEEREGLKTVEWEVEVVSVDPIVRALCRNREDRITPSEDRTYMIRTVQEMHQTMLTVYFLPIALFMVQWQDVDKVNVLDESAQFLGPTDIIKEKKEVPEKLLKKTGMEFLIFLRLLKRSLSEAQKSMYF